MYDKKFSLSETYVTTLINSNPNGIYLKYLVSIMIRIVKDTVNYCFQFW